jgi:nicotinamide-nucleotide amidase
MRELRSAGIVAVGSELLTAFRQDTNSLFAVRAKAVVGDHRGDLAAVMREALARADVVITTGGLGPTDDDLTREVVADLLGLPLEEREEILAAIRARFERRRVPMPAINRRQALVPRGALALPNPNGTAPGLWIEAGDQLVVLLPGPPRELQPMFETHVAPGLEAAAGGRRLRRRVIKVQGRSESQVEETAYPIYSRIGDEDVPVDTTILATPGQIELHLTASGTDVARLDARLEDGVRRLVAALGDVVFSDDGRSLEMVAGDALKARGWRLAAAESCTGGLILGRLTDVPGSSAWVSGGVVAYANDVKVTALGVPLDLIETHGAVSEPVALAMADGARSRLGADIGVAVTGIAGPDGATALKPVGTVVIAVTGPATLVKTLWFPGDRPMVRTFSVAAAIDLVRRVALDH